MRKTLTALIAIVALALVTACGPSLSAGKVVQRSYDDPDDWTSLQCISYGKYGCTAWMPANHHDGPHWYLTLEGIPEDGDETIQDNIEVSETYWNTCIEGRKYPECTQPGKY